MRVQDQMNEIYKICKEIEGKLDFINRIDWEYVDKSNLSKLSEETSSRLFDCYLLLDKIREKC